MKGANLAQIDKIGEDILQTILKNTPRAMPAILQRCDAGVVMENEKIELDFQKAFGSSKGGEKNKKEHDMVLLKTLSLSPFQEYVEHPLLEAFVRHKFDRVKSFFWFVTLLPIILFAGRRISLHCMIHLNTTLIQGSLASMQSSYSGTSASPMRMMMMTIVGIGSMGMDRRLIATLGQKTRTRNTQHLLQPGSFS